MKGLVTHRVEIGDSLQRIARQYDLDNWQEIAEINRLEPPYINSIFEDDTYKDNDRVAEVGDLILIPTPQAYTIADNKDKKEIEATAYGKDLDLYHRKTVDHEIKGRLEINQADVDTVTGLENLGQQLQSRLSVTKGTLFMHPEFGSELYKYYGKNYSQENVNKIMFEIESCIRSDFRVKDIKEIDIKVVKGQVIFNAEVIPIEPGKPFSFKYII